MSPLVETANFYLALGGILSFVGAGILVFDLVTERALASYVKRYGGILALGIVISGTSASLIYSDVFGFVPCGLCWLSRIFLFSQLLLLPVALWYRDTLFARYGLALSLAGMLVGLYHHYLQMGGSAFIKCPAAGTVDCAKRIMFEFDFMTFPLLATSGFALLAALYVYLLKIERTPR